MEVTTSEFKFSYQLCDVTVKLLAICLFCIYWVCEQSWWESCCWALVGCSVWERWVRRVAKNTAAVGFHLVLAVIWLIGFRLLSHDAELHYLSGSRWLTGLRVKLGMSFLAVDAYSSLGSSGTWAVPAGRWSLRGFGDHLYGAANPLVMDRVVGGCVLQAAPWLPTDCHGVVLHGRMSARCRSVCHIWWLLAGCEWGRGAQQMWNKTNVAITVSLEILHALTVSCYYPKCCLLPGHWGFHRWQSSHLFKPFAW